MPDAMTDLWRSTVEATLRTSKLAHRHLGHRLRWRHCRCRLARSMRDLIAAQNGAIPDA